MKSERRMRDFSLSLINVLVWFEILWATVFLVGIVFQWSGLTDQLATAFFGSGFCALLVLLALTLLNVTANLNIISKAQASRATGEPPPEIKTGSLYKTLAVAGTLIGLVVLSLWFAEWRVYKSKAVEAVAKLDSIADTKLAGEAARLINENGNMIDLVKVREALSDNIQSGERLSFVFPEKFKGAEIYREFTAWWYDSKNSETTVKDAGLPRFVPNPQEREKFEEMIKGKTAQFTAPTGGNLRAFKKVDTQSGTIIFLLDTSRRSDYSRSSFK